MKYLVLILMLSLPGFAQVDQQLLVTENRDWRFSYLSFESFLELPIASQIEYIRLTRMFLLQQEMRKSGDSTSMLQPKPSWFFMNVAEAAEPSPLVFPDTNGRCNFVGEKSTLSKELQYLVRNGRDQCVIAGKPVCMAIVDVKNESRLLCKLENMPAVSKTLKCDGLDSKLIRCGGLFLGPDGTVPCVEPKAGSTAACAKAAPKVEDVIAYFNKNSNAKISFEEEFADIRKYCGRNDKTKSFDITNAIDIKDCEILNERLRQVEAALTKPAESRTVADCTLKAREEAPALKSDLRFQFREKVSNKYQVQVTGKELKAWGVYDGKMRLQKIDKDMVVNSAHNGLTLARWAEKDNILERIDPNYSDRINSNCQAAFILKQEYIGKLKDGQCVVQLKKRDGSRQELKINSKGANGDNVLTSTPYPWLQEEVPAMPELAGSPKGSKVSFISTRSLNAKDCSLGIRWDLDGTPSAKPDVKSTGKGSVPAAQNQTR